MNRAALLIALGVLVPVMLGPAPARAGATALTARLCGGGTVTIPLGPRKAPLDDPGCHPKGCHAGTCRSREKREI